MGIGGQRLQAGWIARCIAAAVVIVGCAPSATPQDGGGLSIAGQVMDEQGGVIVGARATLTDSTGRATSGSTNQAGKFLFPDLKPGNYAVQIAADHFRTYRDQRIQVASGQDVNLTVTLRIAGVEESITVFPDTSTAQFAEYVGGSLVIRGDALMALDGPGGLEAFLRALALRTGGPFGPSTLVNGFEDAQVPPTYSIREIRINDNPFSAEYATLGLGRIEILTKPGSEQFHASTFGMFGGALFNSRNPFSPNKIHYESHTYGGNVSGPISSKPATFFADLNRQRVSTNAVINATILDPLGRIVPLRQAVVTPQSSSSASSRLDYQMGANHTWVLRYADSRSHARNSSVGGFSLPSRAVSSNGSAQTFQMTETAVLNSKSINETRVQYVRTNTSGFGDNSTPTINVQGAFIGGGADISASYNRQSMFELQDITSWQKEKHILKFGLQVRYVHQTDGSTQNFGGAYTFASRVAPQLDSRDQVVIDADGNPVMGPITTLEAYRRTLLFREQGLSAEQVRRLGGGASQFSITTGQVQASAGHYQVGAFVQDNWRFNPNLTLSGGLRYEHQSNVSRKTDLAPRVGFAWGVGRGKTKRQTVIRGGIGIFYERIPDRIVLRARQMDGIRQTQHFVSDNSILDLFPTIPAPNVLSGFAVPQSTVRLASDLRAPYTVNSSVAVERQLSRGFSIAATASRLRSVHLLRSRSVNAPIPGSFDPAFPERAIRPFGTSADIFQYESSGVFGQRQLLLNIIFRAGKDVTLWSTYTLSHSRTDADSPDMFPANSYDLHAEYGRAASQAGHTFYWGGWIRAKRGIELTPLVLWRSTIPFDITTGRDANGDTLFNDRPAFATDMTRPSVVVTSFGAFDLSPLPGQRIIPRNYGSSPSFFIANLRVGKRIALTKKRAITLSVQGTNIFNHTNPGLPIGNLGSPLFGKSNISAGDWGFGSNEAGNRRLDAMLYFAF